MQHRTYLGCPIVNLFICCIAFQADKLDTMLSTLYLSTHQPGTTEPPGSMTQLLSHAIAHSTGPSFMIKANSQRYKNFLGLA